MTATMKLHAKLAEVMAEAERIPKNGTAPAAMGGFKFVQVGDAADFIRKALGARKVSMLPSAVEIVGEAEHATSKGGTMTTVALRTTWTLTDGETGETAVIQSYGVGADTGDKYSGKAQTNAMKYALLMGFQLSTGDDVEMSDTSDRRARRAPEQPQQPAAPRFNPGDAYQSGLIGKAEKGKGDADFELRMTPTGHRLVFRLSEGRSGIKVEALDVLAQLVAAYRAGIEGQRVTVWGEVRDETFTPKGTDRSVTYQVLTLARLKVGDLDLTEPDQEPAADADFEAGWIDAAEAQGLSGDALSAVGVR